jgi:hypothetical protein
MHTPSQVPSRPASRSGLSPRLPIAGALSLAVGRALAGGDGIGRAALPSAPIHEKHCSCT